MGHNDTNFKLIEIKSDTGTEKYLEGFVSTSDPDLYLDIVSVKAQRIIKEQLVGRKITMDLDHDDFVDKNGNMLSAPLNKIPVGVITKAELRQTDNGEVGNWVKVKLNQDYPKFKSIYNSIKGGFLHSFSIAYTTLKSFSKKINQSTYNVIDDLNILNFAITGNPVNTNATFDIALKSFKEKNNPNLKMEEKIKNLEKETVSLKSKVEDLTKELATEKEASVKVKSDLEGQVKTLESEKADLEMSAKETSVEVKSLKLDQKEVVSLKSDLEERDVKLKSVTAELEEFKKAPQLKSIMDHQKAVHEQLFSKNAEGKESPKLARF